jgi:hypothetical protein
MSFDEGEFNIDPSLGDVGYRRWREQLDEVRRAFEQRWGVILDRSVRIRLEGPERSIQGVIRLVSSPLAAKPQDIRLRIKTREFTPAEIESITPLDP